MQRQRRLVADGPRQADLKTVYTDCGPAANRRPARGCARL